MTRNMRMCARAEALAVVTLALVCGACHRADTRVLPRFDVRRHFAGYNWSAGWDELGDPKNDPILQACLVAATPRSLESLEISDLTDRLEALERAKLVRRTGGHYELAFPAIIGERQEQLTELVTGVADELLPMAEKMIEDIRPHLNGREEMLYHVLWSYVMDGRLTWQTLVSNLAAQVNATTVEIDGTAWVIYPSHPHRAGTNIYGVPSGVLTITWSPGGPLPNVVRDAMKGYESDLIASALNGKAVEEESVAEALAPYGCIGSNGMSRIAVWKPDSGAARVGAALAAKYAQEVMARLDFANVADMLDVTPAQALVIAYHELCYELLGQLEAKGALDIPKVTVGSPEEEFRFVSFVVFDQD